MKNETSMASVEIWRGNRVESAHRATISVMRDDGAELFAWGDTAHKIFPRSAVKLIQALPLVMSGAADAFGVDARMLALACSSHSGEPEHAQCAGDMLRCAGLGAEDLECGTHWPPRASAARDMARDGQQPTTLHNACSGKHSGFLLYAKHKTYSTPNYVKPDHPVQRDIRALLESLSGAPIDADDFATDGCAIPVYAMPQKTLALIFAKLGTGHGVPDDIANAAQRLRAACASHPFYVAGTGRFDTKAMQHFGQRAFVKFGTEGVYCAVLPELKLGITIKCQDGAMRAAECLMANTIAALLPLSPRERDFILPLCMPVVKNLVGEDVGQVRLNPELSGVLAELFKA